MAQEGAGGRQAKAGGRTRRIDGGGGAAPRAARRGLGLRAPRLSRATSSPSPASTACSPTANSPGSGRRQFPTINPATEETLARVALAGQADVDRAVTAARAAYEQVWGPMPGAERAKYLYRIARILQERAREFAVLESLDNGKPIKESRDVDVPLAAAHFFYHAGWADKLEYAGLGQAPRPLGVAGQVIPWNSRC